MTDRRVVAAALAFAIILPTFLASGQASGGELVLRVAMQDDIKGLNPMTVSDVWSWNVLGYIYDGTMNADPDTEELIPYIAVGSASISGKADSWDDCAIGNFGYSPASSWQNQSKREAIIFYDFENVMWHDGTQMDIRDVLFSMHAAAQVPAWSQSMNPLKADNFTSTGWLEVYKVWESSDGIRAALKFRQQEPYAGFFRDTLSTFLLPYHTWGGRTAGQNVDNAKIWSDPGYHMDSFYSWNLSAALSYRNDPPIGSGPFKFERWDKGQFIRIDTFREHFYRDDYKYKEYVGTDEHGRSNARQPNIDAVAYSIYKTAEAAVLALKNDDIDYIAWSVPPSFVQELANEPGVALQQSPEPGFFYLAYNMRKPSFGYNEAGEDVGKPLRQAIAHCIDKQSIVARLLLNLGVAGTGPVSPLSEWYNSSVPTYDFNTTKAKQILADAGYGVKISRTGAPVYGQAAIDAAGNGNWWVNPDGTNIGSSASGKIEILTPEGNYEPMKANQGLMIAQQLRDIGIYAESVAMDFGSILDRMESRDFDMYISGWRIGSEPTDFLHAFYHSSNALIGQNYAGYQNSSFDTVIDLARTTGDPAVKKQAVLEAQAAICYDLPNDVLYFRTNIEAYRSDRFVGWVVGATGSIYNWRSLQNIRPPGPWKLNAQFVGYPSAVASNSTTSLSVLVRDNKGNRLADVNVTLASTSGSLAAQTGVTGSDGTLEILFSAPYVSPLYYPSGTPVSITIKTVDFVSEHGDISSPAVHQISIKVFPEGAKYITAKFFLEPDIIPDATSDGKPGVAYLTVQVRDQDENPVSDANVTLSSSEVLTRSPPVMPPELAVEPRHGFTDSDGNARFRITAPNFYRDNDMLEFFSLSISISHPDYPDSHIRADMPVPVRDTDNKLSPPPRTYTGETVLALAGIFIAAIAISAAFRRRRR